MLSNALLACPAGRFSCSPVQYLLMVALIPGTRDKMACFFTERLIRRKFATNKPLMMGPMATSLRESLICHKLATNRHEASIFEQQAIHAYGFEKKTTRCDECRT